MILIRSQAAAFRRNLSEGENSDLNLTSEGEQSSQDLLSQNISFGTLASIVKPSIKSKSLLKDNDMFEINSHLTKAIKISLLNESSD
jgi:hypothetical protein